VADLIWRRNADGAHEAELSTARFYVRRDTTPKDNPVYWSMTLADDGPDSSDETLVASGFVDREATGKAYCQAFASWAASCGAAQDRAGRGEVGL